MSLGFLSLHIHIPGCSSLKEKRTRLKPLITRLQREFNISVTEFDHHDVWQSATIACAIVTTDVRHTQRSLQSVIQWVEKNWPDVTVINEQIEIL
jgi:uncharacterized protein